MPASKNKYLGLTRDREFEKAVSAAVVDLIPGMEDTVTDAVKLRYVTHVFSKELETVSLLLESSRNPN